MSPRDEQVALGLAFLDEVLPAIEARRGGEFAFTVRNHDRTIGAMLSGEIEVFHQHGIPFVIGSCWADTLTEAGYDEVFRTSVYSSKLAENMVAVMKANGITKAASLVEDTDYKLPARLRDIGINEGLRSRLVGEG